MGGNMIKRSITILVSLAAVIVLLSPDTGEGIPAFARKYGFSCTACHIAPPKLKGYGEEFAANGFQLPDKEEPVRQFIDTGDDLLTLQRNFPVAVRFDAFSRYRTEGKPAADFQTPWGLKLLSGGTIADNIGYYFYFYMNEHGEVAGVEDAYLHFNDIGGSEFDLMIGQFQISDPLYKRELRFTYEDFQIYRTVVGDSPANLTYDRGIVATYTFPTNTDIVVEVVNGNGIGELEDGFLDNDVFKNVFARVAQSFDPISIGAFTYLGSNEARRAGRDIENEFLYWGPDINLVTEQVELNIQYIRRTDDNPDFAVNPGGDYLTEGWIGRLFLNPDPDPDSGRFFPELLYNRVSSEYPGLEYETVTAHLSYLLRRNLRLLGEYTRDIENENNLFTVGFMTGM